MKDLLIYFKLLLLCVICTTGCISTTNHPPLKDEFFTIYREKYIKHVNDCSNKSAKYCTLLKWSGYDADVIITIIDMEHHAIVRVKEGNKFLYCCPTEGTWSKSNVRYGVKTHLVLYDEFSNKDWRNEFKINWIAGKPL